MLIGHRAGYEVWLSENILNPFEKPLPQNAPSVLMIEFGLKNFKTICIHTKKKCHRIVMEIFTGYTSKTLNLLYFQSVWRLYVNVTNVLESCYPCYMSLLFPGTCTKILIVHFVDFRQLSSLYKMLLK